MSAYVFISISTKSVENIAGWPKSVFCRLPLLQLHGRFRPGGMAWSGLIPRLGCSRLIMLPFGCYGWTACYQMTCCEFVRRVEVALPRVVALLTCCSTCSPSAVGRPLMVGSADRLTILSRSCLMVWTVWFVPSTIPSSWAYWLTTWARSTSVCSATFSFLGLWRRSEGCNWFWFSDGWFWAKFWEWVLRGIMAIVNKLGW